MLVKVTLPDEEMDAIHAMRGSVPLSAWIRDLVHDAVLAGGALAAERAAAGSPVVTLPGHGS